MQESEPVHIFTLKATAFSQNTKAGFAHFLNQGKSSSISYNISKFKSTINEEFKYPICLWFDCSRPDLLLTVQSSILVISLSILVISFKDQLRV